MQSKSQPASVGNGGRRLQSSAPAHFWTWGAGVALSFVSATSWAGYSNTGVVVEGVSTYVYPTTSTDCDTEAQGFYNEVTKSGYFTKAAQHYDNDVPDKNFLDPDLAGGDPNDNDTVSFDANNHALALVCAHGTCNDVTSVGCSTNADCSSGYCPKLPPTGTPNGPACIADVPRDLYVNSTSSIHGNYANYAPGNARWGESSVSGTFGGAAENGSDIAVFLINSCAVRFHLLDDLLPAFAGAAIINLIMPTSNITNVGGADAVTWTNRGQTLGDNAIANLSGSIVDSWAALLNSAPSGGAKAGCPNLDQNFTYGGSYGIWGCGAHLSISADDTASDAAIQIGINWETSIYTLNASQGNEYYSYSFTCNYDCNKYGL